MSLKGPYTNEGGGEVGPVPPLLLLLPPELLLEPPPELDEPPPELELPPPPLQDPCEVQGSPLPCPPLFVAGLLPCVQ